jgi:hypothetical protein
VAKTKPKKKGGGLASKMSSQVKAETSLRYSPQERALKSTLSDLRSQLTTDVQRAHAGAEGIKASAIAAKPELTKAYGAGKDLAAQTQADLAGKLSAVSPGLLSGPAARDAEGTIRRLGEAQATATADMTKRAADAKSGEALQVANLTAGYGQSAAKVRSQLQGVASDRGTYAAARSGELSTDAKKQAHDTAQKAADRKTRLLTGGVTPSGKVRPGGPKDPKLKPGAKAKATKSQGAFDDEFSKARAAVAKYVGKLPRNKVAALLVSGAKVPATTDTVDTAKLDRLIAANPASGEAGHLSEGELRRRATVKGSPAVTVDPVASSAALSAALDLAYDKHLSPATITKLRSKYPGIQIKKTGLPTRSTAPKPVRSPVPDTAHGN